MSTRWYVRGSRLPILVAFAAACGLLGAEARAASGGSRENIWINEYKITGAGTGAGWSWEIEDSGTSQPLGGVGEVDPLPPNGSSAYQVALAFASSLNKPGSLDVFGSAQANEGSDGPGGTATLIIAVQTSGTGFDLAVGPENSPTCVMATPTASCPFNPTIEFVSETDTDPTPDLSRTGTIALAGVLLGLGTVLLLRRIRAT
jgi:hypothetical protein